MTNDVTTFTSTIRFCGLFKPLALLGGPNSGHTPRYGCTVNADDVPTDLQEYITRKPISREYTELHPDLAGSIWCHITQRHAPQIVLTDGTDAIRSLISLCEMAESTNVKPDSLLHEIPATLAVRPVEWIEAADYRKPAQQMKRLQIVAIQFAYDDLVRRFDELQREFFK